MNTLQSKAAKDTRNLVELYRNQALIRPRKTAFNFLQYRGEKNPSEETLSFEELDEGARSVAALLQEREGEGKQAVLIYYAGLDYIQAYFGSLYAGTVAVPAYPPGS